MLMKQKGLIKVLGGANVRCQVGHWSIQFGVWGGPKAGGARSFASLRMTAIAHRQSPDHPITGSPDDPITRGLRGRSSSAWQAPGGRSETGDQSGGQPEILAPLRTFGFALSGSSPIDSAPRRSSGALYAYPREKSVCRFKD